MDDSRLKELVESYRPNDEVLRAMARIRILALVGASASGKSTLLRRLLELSPRLHMIKSETTRPPRENEADNPDYLFRSQEEVMADLSIGNLVQVAFGPNGDLYSTRLQSYPDGIGVMAFVPAAVRQFRSLPVKSFQACFIVPANYLLWTQWLGNQAQSGGWDQRQLQQRLMEAIASYEFALADKQINFVLNDTIEQGAQRLLQVTQDHSPDNEDQAKQIAQDNLRQLKANLKVEST